MAWAAVVLLALEAAMRNIWVAVVAAALWIVAVLLYLVESGRDGGDGS